VATRWAVSALMLLTFVTGLVDALSYLRLGQVFVGNMTGNVVFLGFSLTRGSGLPVVAPIVAMLAFVLGSTAGGRLSRYGRGGRLWAGGMFGGEAVLLALLAALIGTGVLGIRGGGRLALIASLAICLGSQAATVRIMGARDITTTVVTQTLAGFAAEGPLGAGGGTRQLRRVGSVLTMFAGAAAGASLLQVTVAWVVGLAAALAAVAAGIFLLGPDPEPVEGPEGDRGSEPAPGQGPERRGPGGATA
jgi:uncharacterized membrane protein YoaK (UPF0700 family)